MGRIRLVAVLGCALVAPAAAQPRPPPPRRLLDAPVFTIRPQGALAAFAGEGVDVVVGWRPVGDAARYRVTLTHADGQSADLETTELRIEKKGLVPGRYQLTVTALDKSNTEGASSEPLPINVIEVRAVPPGADQPTPPARGAYAVGTRFSVAGMHCEVGNAAIDDLLVGPENELRLATPGVTNLRCAGIPGYLEKQVVIAPVSVAVHAARVPRGTTTAVHVTVGSVAFIGDKLEVDAVGDVTLGTVKRTDFGVDVPVTASLTAKTGALRIRTGDHELGRVELVLADAPAAPPAPPRTPLDVRALDVGGQFGVFFPPSGIDSATTIGKPTDPADTITSGPLVGVRLGFFPARRVGIEGEASLVAGGYRDESGVSQILATRVQLAVRAIERGRFGLRFIMGTGAWTTLRERKTSRPDTEGEVHAGAALTVETSPYLWLRLQVLDLVTSARDDGYAHVPEVQLGIVTRFGRHDSF